MSPVLSISVVVGLIGLVTSQRVIRLRSPFARSIRPSHRYSALRNIVNFDPTDNLLFNGYNMGLADLGVGGLFGARGLLGGVIGRRPMMMHRRVSSGMERPMILDRGIGVRSGIERPIPLNRGIGVRRGMERPISLNRRIGIRSGMGRRILLGDVDTPDFLSPDYPDVVYVSRRSVRSPLQAARLQRMTDADEIVLV